MPELVGQGHVEIGSGKFTSDLGIEQVIILGFSQVASAENKL